MNKKLQRIPHEGAVAGVCAGLGEYFGVDKTWIRVGFIVTIFFAGQGIGFAGPLLYIILWVVLPVKSLAQSWDPSDVDYRVRDTDPTHSALGNEPLGGTYAPYAPPVGPRANRKSNDDRLTAGITLLGIGIFFLLLQLDMVRWSDLGKYWPVLLIFVGLVNIFTAFPGRRRQPEPVYESAKAQAEEADSESDDSQETEPDEGDPKN